MRKAGTSLVTVVRAAKPIEPRRATLPFVTVRTGRGEFLVISF